MQTPKTLQENREERSALTKITAQQAIERAGKIQRRKDYMYMGEIFDMWEALTDVTDKFMFLESLPREDQMYIARRTEDEDLATEIWGSLEKCYQWAEREEARLRLDNMKGETLADKLKNELYELYMADVPFKQYYLLFKDRKSPHLIGNILGQLVYWSTRSARYKRDGLFWKVDEELAREVVCSVRAVEEIRKVLHNEYGYIESYGRHFVGGVSTMHYKLDEDKIALDFQVALSRYMHRNRVGRQNV